MVRRRTGGVLRVKKIIFMFLLLLFVCNNNIYAADARYVLNSAPLTPTVTGLVECDELVAETLASITNDSMTTYDKVKACYDYLINTCSYGQHNITHVYRDGYMTAGEIRIPSAYEDKYAGAIMAYHTIKLHRGVCTDYACAFAALVRAIGVNCYTVAGETAKANGGMTGHVWNVINVGGKEYVFDAQIDDNIARGGAIGYYRFCVTYDEVPWAYANGKIDRNFKSF